MTVFYLTYKDESETTNHLAEVESFSYALSLARHEAFDWRCRSNDPYPHIFVFESMSGNLAAVVTLDEVHVSGVHKPDLGADEVDLSDLLPDLS